MNFAEITKFLEFLIENAGILLTVLFLILAFPMLIAILNWRSNKDMQKNISDKLDHQGETLNELYGIEKGIMSLLNVLLIESGIISKHHIDNIIEEHRKITDEEETETEDGRRKKR